MSTKIFNAYRMPVKQFSERFLPKMRQHVFKAAAGVLKRIEIDGIDHLMRKWFEDGWHDDLTYEQFATPERRESLEYSERFKLARAASIPKTREPYCIDCWINVWIYKGKAYCRMIGEAHLFHSFKPYGKIVDYSYYDNDDAPDGISQRAWDKRGATWDMVLTEDEGARRMYHTIIDGKDDSGFHDVASLLVPKERVGMAYLKLAYKL